MNRHANAPDTEPEESNFKLPSEKEHLLQVVENWPDDSDPDVIINRIEVVGGDENGLSLLHRVNINYQFKGFYYTRMFLKSIGEPYKGSFDIDPDHWTGRQFYGVVVHNKSGSKTYANIDAYNFDKKVEQFDADVKKPDQPDQPSEEVKWGE